MDYLPFWLGGLALGGVAVWTWVVEGRTLGISGQVTAVVDATRSKPVDTPRCDVPNDTPVGHRILFLLFLALGAGAASLLDGSFAIRTDFGDVHNAFAGDGWTRYALVLGGGIAVGFGTRMAGGCTSGHGLTGCARMRPRSVLATCVFLGTAILFTLLTKALT